MYFTDYKWIFLKKIDCNNPPIGINVSYKNGSNIPIKIKEAEIKIFWNNFLLNPPKSEENNPLYSGIEESILPPGENFSTSQINSNSFSLILNSKKELLNSNYLKIDFSAIISNLNGSNTYKLNFIHYIGIDCNNLESKDITTIKEVINPL